MTVKKVSKVEEAERPDLPPMPDEMPDNSKPPAFVFEDKRLPEDIYYAAGNDEMERFLPFLIGHGSTAKIETIAHGRNVKPVAMLRQGLLTAFDLGAFDISKAREKRTGNDDRPEWNINQRMKFVLGASVYGKVVSEAKRRQVTNLQALYHGVAHALEVGCI